MRICAVTGCSTNVKNCGEDLSLHVFPKNPDVQIKWLEALYQEGDVISNKKHYVCSKHFEQECFSTNTANRCRLLANAVPTLLLGNDESTREVSKMENATRKYLNFVEETGNIEVVYATEPVISITEAFVAAPLPSPPSFYFNSVPAIRNASTNKKQVHTVCLKIPLNRSNTSTDEPPMKVFMKSEVSEEDALRKVILTQTIRKEDQEVKTLEENVIMNSTSEVEDIPETEILEKAIVDEDRRILTVEESLTTNSKSELENASLEETVKKKNSQTKTLEKNVNINSKSEVEDTRKTKNLKKAIVNKKRKIKTAEKSKIMNSKSEVEDTLRKLSLEEVIKKKNRKIKTLQDSIYRRNKRVLELKEIIKELKNKRSMEDDDMSSLKDIGGPQNEFLARQISLITNQKLKKKYEADLRAFALTLHYKSPNAYNFVRKVFLKALPCTRTLARWYQVNGEPGLSSKSFTALKEKYPEFFEHNYC